MSGRPGASPFFKPRKNRLAAISEYNHGKLRVPRASSRVRIKDEDLEALNLQPPNPKPRLTHIPLSSSLTNSSPESGKAAHQSLFDSAIPLTKGPCSYS